MSLGLEGRVVSVSTKRFPVKKQVAFLDALWVVLTSEASGHTILRDECCYVDCQFCDLV